MSKIEWTDTTWNPVTGCTKISAGCKNCYAERMARRLQAMGQANYVNGFDVTMHNEKLDDVHRWKKPRMVFVCSMADLFHDDVSDDFKMRVFERMRQYPKHTFQVLTKRPQNTVSFCDKFAMTWPTNVWAGTTVEHQDYVGRIGHLRKVAAPVRFLSCEPLLGPLENLDLTGIHWVIVGGESGPGARPMNPDWVRSVRDQCQKAGVPFFFKQWGGVNKKKAGRELDGRTWEEMPR